MSRELPPFELVEHPGETRGRPVIPGPKHRELAKSIQGQEELRRRNRGKLNVDSQRRNRRDAPFVFWDGEGGMTDTGHELFLWGCSAGKSIHAETLDTVSCLELLLEVERDDPNAYHVIFSGTYDVNMILRDVPWILMEKLAKGAWVKWGKYRLHWANHKFFAVSVGHGKERVSVTLYDVWAFFATSFVKALLDYLGDHADITAISEGKERRKHFTYAADYDYVRAYWEKELEWGVLLMDKLRDNLAAADLLITSWHGPGAIASLIFKKQGIAQHKTVTDPEIYKLLQHAYVGGRSELLKGGVHYGKVYQYDINSAYPAWFRRLPSLKSSAWTHHEAPVPWDELDDFGLYHIRATSAWREDDAANRADALPYPLFWRARTGAVYFPPNVDGWYWGVEAKLARDFADRYDHVEIVDAWQLHTTSERPFSYIDDMFTQRRKWKAAGNPANIAYKLGLNSTYGKAAQRVGSTNGEPPKWHQLEWAGWCTAAVRAQLYRAMMLKPKSVISCSTDSVYSIEPLDLPISADLGDWEYAESDGIIAMQSGVYFLLEDGKWKDKTRGYDKGSLKAGDMLAYLDRIDHPGGQDDETLKHVGNLHRFGTWGITHGRKTATSTSAAVWRNWFNQPKMLTFGDLLSKRGHHQPREKDAMTSAREELMGRRFESGTDCFQCRAGVKLSEGLHSFGTPQFPEWVGKSLSSPSPVPWSEYRGEEHSVEDFEDEVVLPDA